MSETKVKELIFYEKSVRDKLFILGFTKILMDSWFLTKETLVTVGLVVAVTSWVAINVAMVREHGISVIKF